MARNKHVGVDSFFAEKDKLLGAYHASKSQTADDCVRTEHGNIAEELTREWLASFLPKRFGVCKGYIITSSLDVDGSLDEWDILVYDAIESPVLFQRGGPKGEAKRAIPVEFVRGIVEVKATLTPDSAAQVVCKLARLAPFMGVNSEPHYPTFLCSPFCCTAIFFETQVFTLSEYRRALDNLAKVYQVSPDLQFMGALVLSAQNNPQFSGYLRLLLSERPIRFPERLSEKRSFARVACRRRLMPYRIPRLRR